MGTERDSRAFVEKKHVLLQLGSIRCRPFVGEVSPRNELYRPYRDQGFEFFTVYVGEPHLGKK
jgi:hypothetical protein